MAAANDTASMALFCDFENIALGVRDAQYEKFDIRPVLERLLAKGSIVVKKAYCDWERYKGFKAAMHEANFELIEIPHVRQSGKNSADIRMVVDALDLCYTKAHVDTFVIISGDSDFSPLVSKLRENAKRVIGVGVKQSCSDLLVTNCDEFIYYDDLVRDREAQRAVERREREKRSPEEEQKRREKIEERKTRAVELASATLADMLADRGDAERVWASVLKEVIKRRNPGFNENYFGFRSFGNLLEEAAARGLLAVGRDEKSGTYVTRAQPKPLETEAQAVEVPSAVDAENAKKPEMPAAQPVETQPAEEKPASRRRGGRRGRGEARTEVQALAELVPATPVEEAAPVATEAQAEETTAVANEPAGKAAGKGSKEKRKEKAKEKSADKPRRGERRSKPVDAAATEGEPVKPAEPASVVPQEAPVAEQPAATAKPRTRRPARSRKKADTPAES